MNIVVLENHPSAKRGGQELSLLDVCRGLAERGHSIYLLHTEQGSLLEKYRLFCAEIIPVSSYRFSKHRPFQSIKDLVEELFVLRRLKPDVVYSNQYFDSLFGALFSQFQHCPFVCHLRLPPPEHLSRQYRYGLGRAKKMIAVSNKTKEEYVEIGFPEEKIGVVYNGINTSDFVILDDRKQARRNWNLEPDDFAVTYAGRLHPVKGVDVLIQAFAAMKRTRGRKKLLIVGRAADLGTRDYRQELLEYAKEYEVDTQIAWMEHCDSMPQLLAASDVVVLPSYWSEPFGRVLIEAMACGTPALGSKVGGIPEILKNEFAAHLFSPGSTDELAKLLERFQNWRETDPELGVRARKHVVERFTIERTVDGIERLLKEAVQMRKGKRSANLHHHAPSAR